MAVRALLKAATPTGSESTPEPTMDLTRFAVDAVRPALPSSSAAAAAATNVVARSIGRGVDSRESGCTCSAATPPRASTQTRLRILTDTDMEDLARDLAIRARVVPPVGSLFYLRKLGNLFHAQHTWWPSILSRRRAGSSRTSG